MSGRDARDREAAVVGRRDAAGPRHGRDHQRHRLQLPALPVSPDVNLARANLRVVYGPLAFAVALVLWAYLSSLVLVFGALMSPAPARGHRRIRG